MTEEQKQPDSPGDEPSLQKALEAFFNATDEARMHDVVDAYPFVAGEQFEDGLQSMIDHAARAGDPDAMFHIQEQLALLEQVVAERAASPTERALEEFLSAADEESARAIFAQHRELLQSDEAAQLLSALEAGDPESYLFLEERRLLWKQLTGHREN